MNKKYKCFGVRVKRIDAFSIDYICKDCIFSSHNILLLQKVFGDNSYNICFNVWRGNAGIPSCSRDNNLAYYILDKLDITKIEII